MYILFLSVAPVTVLIVNKGDQLVVGEPSDIVCRSSGSRPPSHITWYLDGKRTEGGTESVSCVSSIFSYLKLSDTLILTQYNVNAIHKCKQKRLLRKTMHCCSFSHWVKYFLIFWVVLAIINLFLCLCLYNINHFL